jgi:hypothetical protein
MSEPIKQPEALRLADALEYASNNWHSVNHQAGAELRRLHAEVERLREAAKQALERLALYYGGNGFAADAEVIKVLHAALKETK